MASHDTRLRVGARRPGTGEVRAGDEQPRPSATYELAVGEHSARLVFDLGDRATTTRRGDVGDPDGARLLRRFGERREDDIVGSGYVNDDPACFPYDHPDQRALIDALRTVDQGVPGRQWLRTAPSDPARVTTRVVPKDEFARATAVDPAPIDPDANPDARRVGAFQRVYGWIAFGNGTYWWTEELPRHSFFSRSQDFSASF